MSDTEQAVVIEPPERADASVIWLHGLGADGHDFEPLVPQLALPLTRATRFVFPHAPFRPVTINGGMVMRAWYDVKDADFERRADTAGIIASQEALRGYVARETEHGVATERIVLAGFSQGGVIALRTGLLHEAPLAGILALSTYLPMAGSLAREASPANRRVPILMAHGRDDPLIPMAIARASYGRLCALGYHVEWKDYPMPHAVCGEEIVHIAAWLSGVIG